MAGAAKTGNWSGENMKVYENKIFYEGRDKGNKEGCIQISSQPYQNKGQRNRVGIRAEMSKIFATK